MFCACAYLTQAITFLTSFKQKKYCARQSQRFKTETATHRVLTEKSLNNGAINFDRLSASVMRTLHAFHIGKWTSFLFEAIPCALRNTLCI